MKADPKAEIADLRNKLIALHAEFGARLIAIESISAVIIAQMAMRSSDPAGSIGSMSAVLSGMADGLAAQMSSRTEKDEIISKAITHTIHRVISITEDFVPTSGENPTP